MRGLSRKWVWRCAAERTPAASRSDFARWRFAARAIRPRAAELALHVLQHREEGVRGGGEAVAHHFKGAVLMGIVTHDIEDNAGDQRLGFLVPVRFAGHAGFIEHEGVGKGAGIFRDIEAGRIERVERIEGGRGLAGDAEGVEDVDRPELLAGAAGDLGVLALGINADHGAVGGEQVRDDGSHALAGPGGCHRQQMGRAVIT